MINSEMYVELSRIIPSSPRLLSANGKLWQGTGVVIDSQPNLIRELHRVETVEDLAFLSKQEAETFALKLCKAWIDRVAVSFVLLSSF